MLFNKIWNPIFISLVTDKEIVEMFLFAVAV